MKQFYTIFLISSLALFASACSYFETTSGEGVAVEHYGTSTNLGEREYVTGMSSTYERDIALHTQGRVEVFGLDQRAVGATGHGTVATQRHVNPSAQGVLARPGVEIFSLGGAPAASSAYPYQGVGGPAKLVVYFDYNSSDLDATDLAQIIDFASLYRAGAVPMISVEGHASPERGNLQDKGNMKVSLDRANAVAQSLVENGVPADRITVQAFGARRSASSVVSRGRNTDSASRRVEIHVR